jgi:hypothetical protein
MSISLSRASGIAFAFFLVASAIPALAQTPPPTPHTPELLGIYPGMPVSAARMALQKHSSKYSVHDNNPPETGFSLMVLDLRDIVNVDLTQAPNDPTVWRISRSQNILLDHPMSPSALISALREKYGKETLSQDRGGGGLYLYWIFDPNGRLLASADPELAGCTPGTFVTNMRTGPPQTPNEIEKRCFGSFFAVSASLNRRTPDLLEAYSVELTNLPYAYSAAMKTLSANNGAAEKARQEQLKKANKNKPSF